MQRMLDDRSPSVDSIQSIGKDIARSASDAEAQQVEAQVADLTRRWDHLVEAADARRQSLDNMMELAKGFHDLTEPFLEWVEGVEKELNSMDSVRADADKIEEQAQQQHNIMEDIVAHEDDLDSIVASGNELVRQSHGDDASHVEDKITAIKARYQDLAQRGAERLSKLEGAGPLAMEFQDAHMKLLQWVQEMEPELRAKEAVGTEADEQVKQLLAKMEEAEPLMKALNESGAHLSKLAGSTEAINIEDIVNKDNKKFAAINDQVQKRAEKMSLQRHKSQEVGRPGHVFCLSLGVNSGCAQPITGQVTSVTLPVIG